MNPATIPSDVELQQLTTLFNEKKLKEAEELANKITKEFPNHGFAWKVLGAILQRLGKIDESLEAKRKAAELSPDDAEAHSNLANAYIQKKMYAQAEENCRKALEIDPVLISAYKNLGTLFKKQARFSDAELNYQRILTIKPDDVDVHYELGLLFAQIGRRVEAEISYRNAMRFAPKDYNAPNQLGILLQEQGKHPEAEIAYRQAAENAPNNPNIHANLGNVLLTSGQFSDAKKAYAVTLEFDPNNEYVRGQYNYVHRMLCDWENIDEQNARQLKNIEQKKSAVVPFTLMSLPIFTPQHLKLAGKLYVETHFKKKISVDPYVKSAATLKKARESHDKLRIGYLSADLFSHATVHLMAGFFENRNTENFVTYLYSYGTKRLDPLRSRMEKACEVFRDIGDLSDEEAAKQIVDDEIDILVDLKGYTQQGRMGISALRPAPVIVSWLGYPGTLGHPKLADYIIGDPVVTPLEKTNDYSETLALMPYCYQPNDRTRQIGEKPTRAAEGLPENAFVFCTFNQSYKITPEMFEIWCRLLNAVPDSVLWLLCPRPEIQENLKREAQARGVDSSRLIFTSPLPQTAHLGRLQLADLAIDTFPYTSHTTASDALWAGLPLATKMGDTFPSRVAASILQAMGLPELVATNDDEYFELVLDLATNRERLAAIRETIAENRLVSPLFDTERFTRDLEKIYQTIWAQEIAGKRKAVVIEPEEGVVPKPVKFVKGKTKAKKAVVAPIKEKPKQQYNSPLLDILQPERLTEVVDIGANPIDGEPPYKPMLSAGLCHVTGFEPQESALAELLAKKSTNESYLPYAVGDGKSHTLKVCRASGMTSLFEPDVTTLELFAVLKPLAEVTQRIEMTTQKLDDVKEIEHLDFLKIDIQGAELSVFQHGVKKLAQAIAIQVEVSFVTLYENQPAMGEIDIELRKQGFIPHCFAAVKKWVIAPCILDNNPRQPLNQLLEADLVYVRDFSKPDLMTDEQLKQLAIVAHHCYGSHDLALRCVMLLEERKALPIGSQQNYLNSLVKKSDDVIKLIL
jgi:FkbM family methyltransferase